MWVCVMLENCCTEWAGAYGTGTEENMKELADDINRQMLEAGVVGYHASAKEAKAFDINDWTA